MSDKTLVNKIYEYIQLFDDKKQNVTRGIIRKDLKCLKNLNVSGTIKTPKLEVEEVNYVYQTQTFNDSDLDISGNLDVHGYLNMYNNDISNVKDLSAQRIGYLPDSSGVGVFTDLSANNLVVNNKVGIGINNPGFPLDVNGQDDQNWVSIPNKYFNKNSTDSDPMSSAAGNIPVTIKASASIWSGDAFIASSDQRIKENIRDVSDNVALQKLRDISCVNYEYKDKIRRGSDTTIGFIAQQVKEHMLMAVSTEKEIIPNEMRVITSPQWTDLDNKFKLTISDLNDDSGNILYRFYVSDDASANDECKKEIYSLENDPKSFIFDKSWNNVFLYGKEVDDFHTVDKNKLFALNFSATQEIDRIQQEEKNKRIELENQLQEEKSKRIELENKLSDILARLNAAGI